MLDGLDDCAALGWLEIELSKRAAEPVGEEHHGQRALSPSFLIELTVRGLL